MFNLTIIINHINAIFTILRILIKKKTNYWEMLIIYPIPVCIVVIRLMRFISIDIRNGRNVYRNEHKTRDDCLSSRANERHSMQPTTVENESGTTKTNAIGLAIDCYGRPTHKVLFRHKSPKTWGLRYQTHNNQPASQPLSLSLVHLHKNCIHENKTERIEWLT